MKTQDILSPLFSVSSAAPHLHPAMVGRLAFFPDRYLMHRQDLGDTTIGSPEECIGTTTASSLLSPLGPSTLLGL